MSTLNNEMNGNPEIHSGNNGPNFSSGFFRARNPLERVEFDDWAVSLDEMIELIL